MVQTHVQRARVLVIATPGALRARQMIDVARRLNPLIEVIARSHSDEEERLLSAERDTRVFMGEKELAAAMTHHLLERLATVEERVQGRTTLRQAD
jgi:CPA2 family monovalent cation:H+ antiporter-2